MLPNKDPGNPAERVTHTYTTGTLKPWHYEGWEKGHSRNSKTLAFTKLPLCLNVVSCALILSMEIYHFWHFFQSYGCLTESMLSPRNTVNQQYTLRLAMLVLINQFHTKTNYRPGFPLHKAVLSFPRWESSLRRAFSTPEQQTQEACRLEPTTATTVARGTSLHSRRRSTCLRRTPSTPPHPECLSRSWVQFLPPVWLTLSRAITAAQQQGRSQTGQLGRLLSRFLNCAQEKLW